MQIYPLLKFIIQLHKKITKDYLVSNDGLSIADLAALHPFSTAILTKFEDVVAALYGPQDPAAIRSALSGLLQTTDSLKELLVRETPEDQETKTNKWFRLCFVQIERHGQCVQQPT